MLAFRRKAGERVQQKQFRTERIGILCHGSGSGSTRAAVDLACALSRMGQPVSLLTLGACRLRVPQGVAHVTLAEPGFPRGLDAAWTTADLHRLARALAEAASTECLRVLHYHYGFPFAEACALMRGIKGMERLPILSTLHGSDIMRAAVSEEDATRLRAALGHADAVTTVSPSYAARLRGISGRPCLTVPNFLPRDRRPERRRGGPGRTPVIIHVSNFRHVKNVGLVGQAYLALRRSRHCRLVLVGDGPHRHALQLLLGPCGDDVRFHGQVKDPLPLLRDADAMLLASMHESFSIAALEAMAAGVPVIGPRIDGFSETVREGEGGLLFTPGRPEDAAGKLLRLFNAPQRYRRLSRSAHAAAQHYDEVASVHAYLALYEGLAPA